MRRMRRLGRRSCYRRLRIPHIARAERETDTRYSDAKNDHEERTDRHWKARKRRKDNEDTEKDEGAGAGHENSISGCHNDNKFAANGVGVGGEMSEEFARRPRYDFLMYLREFARDSDARYSIKFFQ